MAQLVDLGTAKSPASHVLQLVMAKLSACFPSAQSSQLANPTDSPYLPSAHLEQSSLPVVLASHPFGQILQEL
jgi:hypothetical protein